MWIKLDLAPPKDLTRIFQARGLCFVLTSSQSEIAFNYVKVRNNKIELLLDAEIIYLLFIV